MNFAAHYCMGDSFPMPPLPASFRNISRRAVVRFSLLLGGGQLLHVFLILVLAVLQFALGRPLGALPFVAGTAGAFAFFYLGARRLFGRRERFVTAALILSSSVIFLASAWICGQVYDTSFDGQTYHQEAVAQLAQGWNPFYQDPTPIGGSKLGDYVCDLSIKHYPRGAEIASATLYRLTGRIETAKVFGLQLMAASFFISLACLLLCFRKFSLRFAIILALLIAFNPVSTCQALSFYIDGQMASVLSIMLATGLAILRRRGRFFLLLWAVSMVLVVNLKFTGVVYAVIVSFAFFAILLARGGRSAGFRFASVTGASFVFAFAFVGFNPYASNTLTFKHPFYPLTGSDSRFFESITFQKGPANFDGLNRLEKLSISLFAQSDNVFGERVTRLKIPFTCSAEECGNLRNFDLRIGGWGPFFGGAVLLGLAIVALAFRARRRQAGVALGLIGILLASALANPQAWWARYTPQLWLVPVIAAGLTPYLERRYLRVLGWILIAVLVANSALVCTSHVAYQCRDSEAAQEQVISIAREGKPLVAFFDIFRSVPIRLKEAGVPFTEVFKKVELDTSSPTAFLCTNEYSYYRFADRK